MHLSSPNVVAFVGLLLSFLISALVGAMNQTRQNRNLVIQEQAKLASIIESTLDAVIGQSLEGSVTSWNRGARELFGYKRDEVIGKKLMDLIVTPLDKKDELDNIEKISQGNSITHFDAVRQRKDGTLVDVSIAVSPITNENGKVIGSSVSCRDITDQKQNEQMILEINNNLEQQVEQRTSELAAASNHLLMAAEVAELGIWTWEIASNKITWNNKMYEIYGYDVCELPENLNYDHWYSRLHPEDSVEAEIALQEAVSGHGVFNPVFRIIQPNGEVHHIQAGAYIERCKDGSAIKVTGINRDITSQVELEAWLRHAKKQSDDASKAKSNFLANMSHEIRTPMNAVLGMLNLIQRTELTRRQKDYAIKATSAASSLLSLLNDILDYSKIDAGKLELETHSFELESVMQELSTILSGNQSDKAVEILFDLPIDIPATLIGDQLRLQQVLINLTSNAFKFTEEGNIVLKVEELLRTNTSTTLQFSVTDTGIGIHPEQMDKIFHGFSQAEASIARKFGGSGLGLVISKTLIELMGGELKVESEIGKGSTFSFSITYQCDKYSVYEKHKEYLDHQLDVLIVDDSQVALDVLANMVRNLGWHADVANNGVQALDLIRSLSDEKRAYDVILLDWQMPNMSGIDMLDVLMKTEGEAFTSKVILITAFAQGALSEIKNLNKLPIADVINKPSTPIQLLNLVHSVLNDQTLSPDSIVIPFKQESKLDGINVLLVEDNALNRQVATELLVMEGANVDIAEGGIEGVVKATAEGSTYDVVLMDMQMPDIDGLEATRRIRENSRLINLPILAMTANVSSVDIKACLDAGMNDHLGKPIEIQFVVERILFWTQEKTNEMVYSFIAEDIDDDDIKTESLQALLQRFSGNKVLFKKVMATFEEDAGSLFQQLRDANNSSNKEQISAVLHTFRGAASTIGAISVVEKLKYLELTMMKTGEKEVCPFEDSELDDLEVMIQLSLFKLNSL
ncbi:response regulator [Marinomonas sp. 15G1-11]|uniref:histidine kinase n=1 Tax=Marinomonas phaeophyticola TaxID=3004091 RepID=A0ABT4JQV1_9GAMM|nr:response regulator [Marinomonas sp. 15G1-11]MCZ2720729.1 response regulator [Marinomonas sp. 15G1-11]